MVSVVKFSEFSDANLSSANNMIVGVGSGNNFKTPSVNSWTTAGRPATPYNGLLGYNTSNGQYEYYNSGTSMWTALASGGSGSGTVNSGTMNDLAYYATSTNAVSSLTTANNGILVTSSGGVPSISSTLPASLNIPQPNIIGVTNGSDAASGSVGYYKESIIPSASSVSISSASATNLTSLLLDAGDWDVWGNISFSVISANVFAWISTSSSTLPDSSLRAGLNLNSSIIKSDTCIVAIPIRVSVSVATRVYISGYSLTGGLMCGGIFARVRR